MENGVDTPDSDYDDCVNLGRKYIPENWKWFALETKEWLTASGHYDKHGTRQFFAKDDLFDEIGQLEYDVGLLKRNLGEHLPVSGKQEATVPLFLMNDEILNSATKMANNHHRNIEPLFLKLALKAVCQNEIAHLLFRLPPLKKNETTIGVLFSITVTWVLVIASPYLLALAISSATSGNIAGATLAFYGIGLALFLIIRERILTKKTPDEIAYNGWFEIYLDNTNVIGVGVTERLKTMMRDGVRVPAIALDLCTMLSARKMR